MARRRSHHLPVLEAGALVGVLAERDILGYRAKTRDEGDWWLAPVSSAMHAPPAEAAPDESINAAADRLAASPDGVLPISENGYLVGFVTATDLLYTELTSSNRLELAPITAADAMSEFLEVVTPSDSLIDAAKLMVDDEIRHLPVVENGRIVGMLSDRDIRDHAGDPLRFVEARDPDARALSVRDAMTESPVTVAPDRPLTEVAEQLADTKVGAIPVVDDTGAPIGIVSYVDVLRMIAA